MTEPTPPPADSGNTRDPAGTASEAAPAGPVRAARRVRLPGFLIEEDTGLGDVIKRATASAGIKTCGGCQRRADALRTCS
ncbi:hypothetical protein ACFYNM_22225 [Streptomyces spororaveus]|uniref:hypothetical protein n=1 Tax=Streptomyces spororaveus TaxID=284039 RepID=UPI0036AEB7A8